MSEAEYVIRIEKAKVYLDDRLILKNLNWKVRRGEHWFILGANGAGKTTLVKTLMGFVWPLHGATVQVLGNTYGQVDLSEVRKKIAWVSPFIQQWTSNQWTGLEIVISGLDGTLGLFRKPEETEIKHALDVMKKLDCAHLAERKIGWMSSGEQVKLLIGRALICNPQLMILDEACVHLDLKSREYLLDTVNEMALRKDSPTMIFITQRLEELLPSFEHGLILREGRILASGSRSEILTEKNLYKTFDIKVHLRKSASGRIWPALE